MCPVSGPELEELLTQGHMPIPLQWIEIDNNEHKRRAGGPHVAPLFKSRSVNRGDLEETTGVRTDSPTFDIEGLNLLLSWASCERLTVKSADITNAYFQGRPLKRLISMRQPPGGVPDADISAVTMFVARIYQEGGEPKAMLATHVDDMLWATKPGYEDRIQQLLDRYTLKTLESGTFRFCGRRVVHRSRS